MKARFTHFMAELRRRRVFNAAAIYAVTAWVTIQVATTVSPLLDLPVWTPKLVLVLALLGFPLMLVFAWFYDVTSRGVVATEPATPLPSPPRASAQSIAVLPFVDMSAAGDQEHFGDGIAEEILNVLARLPHLHVAARTSAFAFKGKQEDVRRIGEQLGVATVLEGSVRAAGNRIRITAQLIDVANGYHLWSERFDRELGDVFAIQDEIAHNIVSALDLKIGGGIALNPRAVTSNMDAYDKYLRGRAHLARLSRHDLERARVLFGEAVAADKDFAAAYASAAEAASYAYLYWDPSALNLTDALVNAERALALAPEQAQGHVAHGVVLSLLKKYDDAAREFETALRIDPRSYDAAYQYGRSRWAAGDMTKAKELFERAAELHPDSPDPTTLLTSLYEAVGDKDAAHAVHIENLRRVERSLALNPDDPRVLYHGAGSAVELGQRERGIEMAERAVRLDPNDAGTWYNVGCLYARMGETNKALEKLEHCIRLGFTHREWIENDNDWAQVRSDPRFMQLLNTIQV